MSREAHLPINSPRAWPSKTMIYHCCPWWWNIMNHYSTIIEMIKTYWSALTWGFSCCSLGSWVKHGLNLRVYSRWNSCSTASAWNSSCPGRRLGHLHSCLYYRYSAERKRATTMGGVRQSATAFPRPAQQESTIDAYAYLMHILCFCWC